MAIVYDMSPDAYYSDPCPVASLTQSLCKVILARSPRHAWWASPKLNPNWKPEEGYDKDKAIGSAAHTYLFERGRNVIVLDYSDFRTQEAQRERDSAFAVGCIPILGDHNKRALEMAMVARHRFDYILKNPAHTEVCVTANLDRGIPARSLIDWLSDDMLTVVDYKTTSRSVAPHTLGVKMKDAGVDIQAAFHERVLNINDPNNSGRRQHIFIMQESSEPYACVAVRLNEEWMTMGRKQVDAAVATWIYAMKNDKWPTYPSEMICPEYPSYAQSKWLDREQTEFTPNMDHGGINDDDDL